MTTRGFKEEVEHPVQRSDCNREEYIEDLVSRVVRSGVLRK